MTTPDHKKGRGTLLWWLIPVVLLVLYVGAFVVVRCRNRTAIFDLQSGTSPADGRFIPVEPPAVVMSGDRPFNALAFRLLWPLRKLDAKVTGVEWYLAPAVRPP